MTAPTTLRLVPRANMPEPKGPALSEPVLRVLLLRDLVRTARGLWWPAETRECPTCGGFLTLTLPASVLGYVSCLSCGRDAWEVAP